MDDNVWTYLAILALYYLFFYGIIMHSPDKCFLYQSVTRNVSLVPTVRSFCMDVRHTGRLVFIALADGQVSLFSYAKVGCLAG